MPVIDNIILNIKRDSNNINSVFPLSNRIFPYIVIRNTQISIEVIVSDETYLLLDSEGVMTFFRVTENMISRTERIMYDSTYRFFLRNTYNMRETILQLFGHFIPTGVDTYTSHR